jgi:hypothetical protein
MCVVVVDPDASEAVKYAATELATFLGQVTGDKIGIVHEPKEDASNLFVGPNAAKLADPDFTTEGLGEEGLIIRSTGNDVILAGGDPRGTLYAVYTFLEDHTGCRWWSPLASTIPRKPNLEVGDLNVRYVPWFEYRETQLMQKRPGEADWSARNRFNGFEHELEEHHGGNKFTYIAHSKWYTHTFWTLLPPPIYWEDHPEYYSEYEGKRILKSPENDMFTSLCLTNEDVIR